jgi:hypothetical protein
VLSVTLRHGDHFGTDRYELAARELRSVGAGGADAERDLIRRAALVSRTTEHLARHREQRGVVIQATTERALQSLHGLSKERKRLRRYLKT